MVFLSILLTKLSKQQKHRRKSAEQKPGLSYVVRQSSSLKKIMIIIILS